MTPTPSSRGSAQLPIYQARSDRHTRGFTRVELVAVLAAIALLAIALLPLPANDAIRASRATCANNLTRIGQAMASWAADHEESYPWQVAPADGGTRWQNDARMVTIHFLALSNELATPSVLVCPADVLKRRATSFAELQTQSSGQPHVSYMLAHPELVQGRTVLSGDRNLPAPGGGCPVFNSAFVQQPANATWDVRVHAGKGHLLFNDGSVEGTDTARLRAALSTLGQLNEFHFIAPN